MKISYFSYFNLYLSIIQPKLSVKLNKLVILKKYPKFFIIIRFNKFPIIFTSNSVIFLSPGKLSDFSEFFSIRIRNSRIRKSDFRNPD